MVDSEVIPSS